MKQVLPRFWRPPSTSHFSCQAMELFCGRRFCSGRAISRWRSTLMEEHHHCNGCNALGFGSILSCMLKLFAEIRSNLIVPHSSVPLSAHPIPTVVLHRTSCQAPSLCLPGAHLQIFFNFGISHSHNIFHKDLHSTQLSHTSTLCLLGLSACSKGQAWSNKRGLS